MTQAERDAMREYIDAAIAEDIERMLALHAGSQIILMREMIDRTIAAIPSGPIGPAGEKGVPGERGPEGVPGRDGRDALPMPGERGPVGLSGADGRDGKDGRDGITLEQLQAAVAEMKAQVRADVVKSIELRGRTLFVDGEPKQYLPIPIYRDVFKAGEHYQQGDMVTFGGSVWHCNNATSEKPGQNGDWTLAAKHGRDAR